MLISYYFSNLLQFAYEIVPFLLISRFFIASSMSNSAWTISLRSERRVLSMSIWHSKILSQNSSTVNRKSLFSSRKQNNSSDYSLSNPNPKSINILWNELKTNSPPPSRLDPLSEVTNRLKNSSNGMFQSAKYCQMRSRIF